MKIAYSLLSAAAAALLLAGGCQSYPNPPTDYWGDSYSQRKKSDADELLKGLTYLSLTHAQDVAIANNPNYIAAYYAINAAQMRYYQALGAYSPVVDSSFQMAHGTQRVYNQKGGMSPNRTDSFNTQTGIGANWLLFNGLARYFQTRIAELGVTQQKALTEDDCRLLIRSVAYAYNSVLLADENKRIANEDLSFQIKNLRDTELKYQAGAVPLSEVLNFRALANVAEGNHITAEYQYEIAIYALAVLMGYPEGTLPPEIKFPQIKDIIMTDLPGVDIYLDNALENRPDLRAYREQLKISEYQLYSTYSSFSPVVYANAQFNFGTNEAKNYNYGFGSSRQYSNVPSFSYGLTANWTIFNGLIRYNKVREAQALLASTKYQVADIWLKVVQEVRNAHINYIQNVKQARLYEKTLEITTKQRDLVEDEYKAGNTELTRLNQAQRDLVDAQTSLASAYINVQNARAQLDAAAAMNVSEYTRAPAVFAVSETVEPDQQTPAEAAAQQALDKAAKDEAKSVDSGLPQKPATTPKAKDDKTKAPAWNPDNLAI